MAAPTNTASMSLCTIDDLMVHKKIKDDAQHPDLRRMIDTASRCLELWCNRKFKYDTYTEICDGTGSNMLWLRNPPVDTVTSVESRLGSDWYTEDITYLRTDDPENVGLLLWDDAVFIEGVMNYRIVYAGGLATTPAGLDDVIRQAAIELAGVMYERMRNDMHIQPSLTSVDGQTMIFRDQPIPSSVEVAIRTMRVRRWD